MRKPFFDGGYAGSTPRMTLEDVQEGMAWVDDRFFPIRYEDEALPSVDWVLNIAKAAVLRSICSYTLLLLEFCVGPIASPHPPRPLPLVMVGN